MPIKMKQMAYLLQREAIDFFKNKNISLMCPIPIVLTLFFTWVQGNGDESGLYGLEMLNMSMNMNLVIVSTFALSLLVAEEKEKKTHISLWLASVSLGAFLLSKAIVIFVLSMVTHVALFFIIGISWGYLLEFLIISSLITVIMIVIGIVIGLLAEHQMSVSFLGLPVVFVYFILPMSVDLTKPWSQVAGFFPNYHYAQMVANIGSGEWPTTIHLKILFLWLFFSALLMMKVYQGKKNEIFNLK